MEMDGGSAPVGAEADPEVPPQEAWAEAASHGLVVGGRAGALRPGGMTHEAAHLQARLLQQIIDAARDGYPNEACGVLVAPAVAADGGAPTRFVTMRNAAASPYRYYLDPAEQLEVMLAMDDAGEELWGIVHSHVASPAEPSATDVGLARYPDALYIICSLAGEVPVVRAWSIHDGEIHEVPLSIG